MPNIILTTRGRSASALRLPTTLPVLLHTALSGISNWLDSWLTMPDCRSMNRLTSWGIDPHGETRIAHLLSLTGPRFGGVMLSFPHEHMLHVPYTLGLKWRYGNIPSQHDSIMVDVCLSIHFLPTPSAITIIAPSGNNRSRVSAFTQRVQRLCMARVPVHAHLPWQHRSWSISLVLRQVWYRSHKFASALCHSTPCGLPPNMHQHPAS